MKQKIRLNTFETNSSSYHTLTIRKVSEEQPRKEIIKGKDLIINTNIDYKTIGYTNSYQFIGKSTYEKAQLVLRFMGDLEDQLYQLVKDGEYKGKNGIEYDTRRRLQQERFYDVPLIKGFVQAIKQFIGEDREVKIEFTESYSPFISIVYDECNSFSSLFDIKDLTDVDHLKQVIYGIIFNKDIEIVEECESN